MFDGRGGLPTLTFRPNSTQIAHFCNLHIAQQSSLVHMQSLTFISNAHDTIDELLYNLFRGLKKQKLGAYAAETEGNRREPSLLRENRVVLDPNFGLR